MENQFDPNAIYKELTDFYNQQIGAVDRYVDDLIGQAAGDRDFIIKQLDREHTLALGNNDQERAKFLEQVADRLEQKIGRIPYDYRTGVQRAKEDLGWVENVTERNKNKVLQRLSEDERVWKDKFNTEAQDLREQQNEALLKRGIISGTREEAQGLAGKEVNDLETKLQRQLEAYDRELARTKEDVNTQAQDTLIKARRETARKLQDLKTQARRGAIDVQDKVRFGKEGASREFEKRKRELERMRELEKRSARMGLLNVKYGY